MEISDEVFINSMNDISKYFQIMLDNKDKKISDLQLQLDQAKSEITKYNILLNDMETENSHLETMLDQICRLYHLLDKLQDLLYNKDL